MCGIFGIIGPRIDEVQVKKATDTLSHRGPNDSGYHFDENAGLGHRRLSIIDLEGGHQPIYNEDGSKAVIFNGEIYNFMELTEDLIRRGHRFSTRSDTETILHAYEEWGESCIEKFRGMFAFAVWDRKEKTLFLARDRLGIKPLFYSLQEGKFYFASEMKAILTDRFFPRDIDDEALASYFLLSYIPAPLTIFAKIRKLLPGHTLTYREGTITIRKYWDLRLAPDYSRSEDFFISGFMDLLQEAVKIRLISEVPLGAFLSGGIDSSAIVALMSRVNESPVKTFSIGFGGEIGGYLDERGFARMVAARYKTDHREHEVLPNPEGLIEKIVRAFDEPFADDSAIPSYYVCKMARENVTVALSGLGGDEVFSGYERYLGFKMRQTYLKIPGFIREGVIRRAVEGLQERKDGHYTVNHMKRFVRAASLSPDLAYLGYVSRINSNLKSSLFSDGQAFSRSLTAVQDRLRSYFHSPNVEGGADSLNRAFFYDIKTYLSEDILAVTDRMSMLHALEVRVPFLDHKFMEFCASIPPEMKMKRFQKKYLLKKAVRTLLPAEVIDHRKQGFVGPMAQWLKNELKTYTRDVLSLENLKKHGVFNPEAVETVLTEHFSNREIHDTLIWSLLIFQTWFEMYAGKKGE
jgi:asparagine synthase (glutamine-hydrolysing)